jgi:hypothetical protein
MRGAQPENRVIRPSPSLHDYRRQSEAHQIDAWLEEEKY